jgi:hypothetical protein
MRQINRKIKDSPEYPVKLAELHMDVWWGIGASGNRADLHH